MKRFRRGRPSSRALEAAFTLVELLVGAAIAATLLGAAYGWLWNLAALAGRADDRAQATSLAAAASRAIAADVGACVRVVEPPSGRDPSQSLALVHDHAGAAAEVVLVVWDPARRVVWRNASGTYLADHMTQFSVAYVISGGSLIPGAGMSSSDWAAVRSVRLDVTATVGSATVRRCIEASVGPS
jgi:type II secretory pathway pseudopilin PulG